MLVQKCRSTTNSLAKIRLSDVGYLIAFTMAVKPDVALQSDFFDPIWDFGTIITFTLIAFLVFIKRKLTPPAIILTLFCAIYCIQTYLITPVKFPGACSESMRIIIMFVSVYVCLRDNRERALNLLSGIFRLYIFIDVSVFYTNYFMGYLDGPQFSFLGLDNSAIFLLVPMFSIVFYDTYRKTEHYGKINVLLFGAVFIGRVLTFALTSVISMLVMVLGLIAIKRSPLARDFFTAKVGLFLGITTTFGVIILRIQEVFSDLLGILGKGITLNYRTVIWDKSLSAIEQSPAFGYGKTGSGYFQTIVGMSPIYDLEATHTHNYFLELLFETGLVGTALFAIFLFAIFNKKNSRSISDDILLLGVFCFIILMFTDSYIFITPFYGLLAVIYSNNIKPSE